MPEPEVPETKIEDLNPGVRKMILEWIDHLLMDTGAGVAIADQLPVPMEMRKKAVIGLLDRGILKFEIDEDSTRYRWLVWNGKEYIPFI